MDLALAVHIADRSAPRRREFPRRIHVRLPVREEINFAHPATIERLSRTLDWFTRDSWTFSFERRYGTRRVAERQVSLYAAFRESRPTEVALWSGGLDSFAGLWARLTHDPDKRYMLVGSGANTMIFRRQADLIRELRSVTHTQLDLTQVPLRLHTPHRTARNRHPRTRGFVFMLIGAIVAALEGQQALHIYENGIGALNLPFRDAEVGLDHSRAVHPLSLLAVSDLVSHLLGTPFACINPFLFCTKAELCAPLRGTVGETLMHRTISCDSRRRQPGCPPQCGRCSSCLLRRHALAYIGVTDQTQYACTDLADDADRFVLDLMLTQRDRLRTCLQTSDPWLALSATYSELVKVVDRTAKASGASRSDLTVQLMRLYARYVHEWDVVEPRLTLEQSLTFTEAAPHTLC
jgi:7-cyano-7-deazaguanine synthase in queuosine biosynthesis